LLPDVNTKMKIRFEKETRTLLAKFVKRQL